MSEQPLRGSLLFDPNELRKRNAWDQIAGETQKAFRAFMIYRNLPPEDRTIRNTWKEYNPDKDQEQPSSHFSMWAKNNHWADRAAAWDRHLLGVKDKASEKVFSKEILLERKNRMEMLENMRKMVAVYMYWANTERKNSTILRSVVASAATYLEQSRKEFGDDPTTEREREQKLQENVESVRQKIQSIMAEAADEGQTGTDSIEL